MRMVGFLLSVALLISPTSLNAQAAPAEKPVAATTEKLVCKSRPRANSRFQTRECRTREEREAAARQHQEAARELINKPLTQPPGQ